MRRPNPENKWDRVIIIAITATIAVAQVALVILLSTDAQCVTTMPTGSFRLCGR